jgi:hypothetical protein
MVELTGEMAEEAQLCLEHLNQDISLGKHFIKELRDFENRLAAIETVVMHINFNYWEYDDLDEFITEVGQMAANLGKILEGMRKKEMLLVAEEKSLEKNGFESKYASLLKKIFEEQNQMGKEVLQIIHQEINEIKQFIIKADHIFELHENQTQIKKLKVQLEAGDEQVHHVLEKLLKLFVTYEQVFKETIEKF